MPGREMAQMEEKQAVCVLCPLGCPIGFNVSRLGVGPEFPARVCARGVFGSGLLRHDRRIATPLVRTDGGLRETSWDAAVERLAAVLAGIVRESGPESVAIVTEPERSTQDLEAVARLADTIGTSAVACAFEPQDWPLATSVESAPVSAIEEANCLIVIGDAFTTHPVIAKTIIDAKFTARDNSLFVVDPRRSNTAWYATTHLQNRPGTEALVFAAILASLRPGTGLADDLAWLAKLDVAGLAAAAEMDMGVIARVARAFTGAEKAAIVLAPAARGVSDVALVATLASLLAKAAGEGKSLVSLPAGGNVAGAVDVAQRHSWMAVSQLRQRLESGEHEALLCLGADVASFYPSAALSKALGEMPLVGTVGLFHGEAESVAQVVLAESTWLESSGQVTLFDGTVVDWEEVAPPSWATLPLTAIVDRLVAAIPAVKPRAAARPVSRDVSNLPERLGRVLKASTGDGDLALVTTGASGHSGAGTITRWVQWARDMFPGGFIELSEDRAAGMGVADGDAVSVSGASGEVELLVRTTDRLADGTAAVASFDPVARGLFDWSPAEDDWFATGPGRIIVRKQSQ